jgi:hypothetical protein
MPDTKSGVNFLERSGLLFAYRNPVPQISPAELLVHSIPLTAPLPLPELQRGLEGSPAAPARGQTKHWPHPGDINDPT